MFRTLLLTTVCAFYASSDDRTSLRRGNETVTVNEWVPHARTLQPDGRPVQNIQQNFITQPLDHFGFAEARTFQQRYFVNTAFHASGGPAFLWIDGEAASYAVWISAVYAADWILNSQRFHALSFLLEHRYYGQSHPPMHATTTNLKWLTIEQALADIARFIQKMSSKYSLGRPRWILFGCSYGGALVAWTRMKYPHLVLGAVASSATVETKVNYLEHLKVVTDVLQAYSPACVANINQATKILEIMIQAGRSQPAILNAFMYAGVSGCHLTQPLDEMSFFQQLYTRIAAVVGKDGINEGPFAENLNVKKVCDIINDPTIHSNVLFRYSAAIKYIMQTIGLQCQLCEYNSFVAAMQQYQGADLTTRLMYYQRCSQLGYYLTSDLEADHPFSHKFGVNYFYQLSYDIFKNACTPDRTNDEVDQVNVRYGGRHYEQTKIIFVNGLNDPWHLLSVLHDKGPETIAINIPGAAHCADTYPHRDQEKPELQEARLLIASWISKWLNETVVQV